MFGFDARDLAADGDQARQVDRILHVHVVVDHFRDQMGVAHGLVIAAHHAEGHFRAAVAGDHARDDRVQRALFRGDHVGMTALQREALAAIVEDDAGVRRNEAGAEAVEDRVDEADRIALFVDDRDVDRVTMQRHLEIWQFGQCPGQVDLFGQSPREVCRKQFIDRHIGLGRIGNPCVAGSIGEAGGLDFQMQPVGGVRFQRVVEAGEDVEDQQRDDALAVWRAFVDGVATEVGGDRGDVFALGFRKILQCMETAMGVEMRYHVFSDRSLVEAVAAFGGNLAERCGKLRLAVRFSDARCATAGQEDLGCRLVCGEKLLFLLPVAVDARRDGIAFLGIADCGCKDLGEG